MDLMMPGQKVELVFSICRIQHFAVTTDCLMTEIIVFVNKIVKVIHLCTQQWDGSPSKNYGDKYMLVWKLPEYKDAYDGDGTDEFYLDPEELEAEKLKAVDMDSKSNASRRSRDKDSAHKEKNPFGNKNESLDDSMKNNTERTSLLGDKTRKSDVGKGEDDKGSVSGSDIGKLSKI
jgi:hypothetical protein